MDFYSIKDEVRIMGVDDGPFTRGDEDVLLVGAVFRGGLWLDGVVSTRAAVDGLDSTERLIGLAGSRFQDVRVMMTDGLAFGGFNVCDINEVAERSGLAVIAVTRDMPDFSRIRRALENTFDPKERFRLMEKAGKPRRVATRGVGSVHIQHAGISFEDAREIVRRSSTRSHLPEPIRCAHLIAQGIVSGESKGKA